MCEQLSSLPSICSGDGCIPKSRLILNAQCFRPAQEKMTLRPTDYWLIMTNKIRIRFNIWREEKTFLFYSRKLDSIQSLSCSPIAVLPPKSRLMSVMVVILKSSPELPNHRQYSEVTELEESFHDS